MLYKRESERELFTFCYASVSNICNEVNVLSTCTNIIVGTSHTPDIFQGQFVLICLTFDHPRPSGKHNLVQTSLSKHTTTNPRIVLESAQRALSNEATRKFKQ